VCSNLIFLIAEWGGGQNIFKTVNKFINPLQFLWERKLDLLVLNPSNTIRYATKTTAAEINR
jgi:hypothetical protein